MQPAVLIRLRPAGPWRFGPGDGGEDRADDVYRSDRLYSAMTLAMRQLGWLEEWLDATARAHTPAVVFSSLFPYQGDTLFVPPPKTLWPPPASQVTASSPVFLGKMRWSAARFVPVSVVESLLTGQRILADQWLIDAESWCLLRRDRPNSAPFQTVTRSRAAVDRLSGMSSQAESCVGVAFEAGAGLWTVARYANAAAHETWKERVPAVFRLLSDGGFGGRRSSGWGHAAAPELQPGTWPALLMPRLRGARNVHSNGEKSLHWLLSVYSPSPSDEVDWTRGDYRVIVRGGRVDSQSGSGAEKKMLRMVAEGSVIAAADEPVGSAVDVAPEGFPHPVYRSGMALTLRLPEAPRAVEGPVETGDEAALDERPCVEQVIPVEQAEPQPEAASSEPQTEAAASEPQPEVAASESQSEVAASESQSEAASAEPQPETAAGEEQGGDEI